MRRRRRLESNLEISPLLSAPTQPTMSVSEGDLPSSGPLWRGADPSQGELQVPPKGNLAGRGLHSSQILCALRSHLSLPSRNPTTRPDGYKLTLRRGTHSWKKKVTLADHPGLVRFMMFTEPAGRVLGRAREQATWSVRFIDAEIFPDTKLRVALLGADSFEDRVTINAMALARLIAKIGHCFAVAELGFDAFEEMYVSHLITNESRDWNYWVGGYDRGRNVSAQELHELRFLRRGNDLSVIVHLLVPYCPRFAYEVIVGRLRPGIALPVHLDESLTV